MTPKSRLSVFAQSLRDMSAAWPLLAFFVLTLAIVTWLQPLKAGLALWGISKIAMSAWFGNVIDRTSFRPQSRPHLQPDPLRHGLAWLRRAIIIAAAIIAGGLIP